LIPALLLWAAFSAGLPPGVSQSQMQELQGKSFSTNADSISRASTSLADSLSRTDSAKAAVRDSSQFKKLPDRVLPLSKQMMYAGGFMIFLALMITSLQNLNPND
jgi:hypothetical protein